MLRSVFALLSLVSSFATLIITPRSPSSSRLLVVPPETVVVGLMAIVGIGVW
jgi:hypothetical protein